MSIEEALEKVGSSSTYQIIITIYFGICWSLVGALFLYIPFGYKVPVFQCYNDKGDEFECNENNGGCVEQNLMPNQPYSITIQYKLYCSKKYVRAFAEMVISIGAFFGNFLFNLKAFARKKLITLQWLLAIIGAIFATYGHFLPIILIGQFIMAFGGMSALILHFVILSEQCGNKFRQIASGTIQIFWALGGLVVSISSYYLTNWKKFQLYIFVIPYALMISGLFILQESPKFNYMINKKQQYIESLNFIAKINKKHKITQNQIKNLSFINDQKQNQRTIVDVFQYNSSRNLIIQACILLFFNQALYYTIGQSIPDFGSNIYLNGIIIQIGCAISYSLLTIFVNKISRRKTYILLMSIQTIFSILFCFINQSYQCKIENNWCWQKVIQIILGLIIMICASFDAAFLYIICEELFPVSISNVSMGFSNAISNIGNLLAPLSIIVTESINISPMSAGALIGFILIIVSYYLPETLNKQIPLDVEEIMNENQEYHINS